MVLDSSENNATQDFNHWTLLDQFQQDFVVSMLSSSGAQVDFFGAWVVLLEPS